MPSNGFERQICIVCQRTHLDTIRWLGARYCEPHFNAVVVEPLLATRQAALSAAADAQAKYEAALEAKSRLAQNTSGARNCSCGAQFTTTADLLAHFPVCDGGTTTERKASRVKRERSSFADIEEIG